ncbi:MAG: bifunctional folylpolyglutamate synthase/dihydrofolate synthase [Deltaproteobacteria bacterium]|nr:MAG: bifunctional folylpolyglutamate synthase/dihydrofolate synthase [Deltaproteobacteria bacterium]
MRRPGIEHVTAFLYSLKPRGIRFGLENTRLVLDKLGKPQDRMRIIHIAGTNGKGSTAAFAESVLRQTGIRTGLYTSPHLHRFTERFRIDGIEASDEAVCEAFARLVVEGLEIDMDELLGWMDDVELVDKMKSETWYKLRGEASRFCRLTFFECTTVMAALVFADAGVDVAIMEVGMGGRLDATNVFEPVVSVITPVSLEHTEWLGDTMEKIAAEKAGIIKNAVPVVCARQFPPAQAVISRVAAEKGAPLFLQGRDFFCEGSSSAATFRIGQVELGSVELGLAGSHQVGNAACALAALVFSGQSDLLPDKRSARRGLEGVCWPARFERFGPAGGWIVDSAHNPHGVKVLVDTFRERFDGLRVPVVFGVLGDKNAGPMVRALESVASRFELVTSRDARALDSKKLVSLCRAPARWWGDVSGALEKLAEEGHDRVIVCGSLTVAAEAREWLLQRENAGEKRKIS